MNTDKYKKLSSSKEVCGHNILPYLLDIAEYFCENGMNVKPLPGVVISEMDTFKDDPLGPTAHYTPETKKITLYTKNRALKDICRSWGHELTHHHQNLEGRLTEDKMKATRDPEYNKNDNYMRKIEAEAYLKGNILFRDWESQFKKKK